MRRNKYLMAGIFFLIISLILVRAQLQRQRHARAREESATLRDMVIARQTIPKWTIITPEMIELQKVDLARQTVPQDALTSLEAAQGKLTRAEIIPGRPIAAGELLSRDELGLSAHLPPGKCAMTIQVSDTTAVAGFLRPGDRVDVLGTFTGEAPVTDTLLQGIQVIAVGKALEQKSLNAVEPNNLVTLAVTPSEARALTFAQTKATIQLVLRPLAEPETALEPSPPPIAREAVRIVARPAQPRALRPARARTTRSGARRPQPQSSAPALGLGPTALPPAKPELITPIPPPIPSRPATARSTSEGPALSAVTPPHTVEVIRGTQRETVTLRVSESKGIPHEPEQDQR